SSGLLRGCTSRCAVGPNADPVQTQHAHRSQNRSGARTFRRRDLLDSAYAGICGPFSDRCDAMTPSNPCPKAVWSLDFELRWGMHDLLGMDRNAYRTNLEGAREAVPLLLDLFVQRGVRATWATVGALACNDWDEYFRLAPPPPAYGDS